VGRELKVISKVHGNLLLGRRYLPPFDYYSKKLGGKQGTLLDGEKQHLAWRIVPADFVTIDSGTGVVHQAPAFGEVDFDVLMKEQARFAVGEGPELICAVGADGKFTAEAPDYQGRWVKECDRDISRNLRHRGLLYHQEQYLHEYPFCWRAEQDPLIQYPRKSWFVRTTQFKERMLENNGQINWLPEHIREGRMGNFLESNVDWALSRERYWGTPLPVWQCEQTGKQEAIGSYAELLTKPGLQGTEVWEAAKQANPQLSEHLKVHKPYIDAITYESAHAPGARMRRVPEVIDCWFDSGAMPFAQWGFPHQGTEHFKAQFPADFISEALDQTRGWFYSQLAISTLLFSEQAQGLQPLGFALPTAYPHPFKNCIVLGLMLGEDGQKMSKSKRNYREPTEIFDKYGADALRWYFFAQQPPWTTIRYSEQAIKDSIPEFLLRLWNVYAFFVIYARIDGFDPAGEIAGAAEQLGGADLGRAKSHSPPGKRSELDRWILSELNRCVQAVTERMDAYDNYGASASIIEFVDALSNWYVRRSRDRFWSEDKRDRDKLDAYWTLYECLLTTSKLIAPFVPFLAEAIWQNLAAAEFGDRTLESVHLSDFPTADGSAIDTDLSARMAMVREIVSQGRAARVGAKLKVRQPLAKVEVILADRTHQPWLEEHSALIAEELNVKQVEFTEKADQYITYKILPNFKRLGPKVGPLLPALKNALKTADGSQLLAELQNAGKVSLPLYEADRSFFSAAADDSGKLVGTIVQPGDNVVLEQEDIEVRLQAKPGWAAAQGKSCVVVLATELNDELLAEGWAREIVHVVQTARKEIDCQYTDRIALGVESDDPLVDGALRQFGDYIRGETLATELRTGPIDGVPATETKVGGTLLKTYVKVVQP
jgi:isoleucyl-tRNA synthetase